LKNLLLKEIDLELSCIYEYKDLANTINGKKWELAVPFNVTFPRICFIEQLKSKKIYFEIRDLQFGKNNYGYICDNLLPYFHLHNISINFEDSIILSIRKIINCIKNNSTKLQLVTLNYYKLDHIFPFYDEFCNLCDCVIVNWIGVNVHNVPLFRNIQHVNCNGCFFY